MLLRSAPPACCTNGKWVTKRRVEEYCHISSSKERNTLLSPRVSSLLKKYNLAEIGSFSHFQINDASNEVHEVLFFAT